MPVTISHDPKSGITATTGALNWPAILKAILAALVAASATESTGLGHREPSGAGGGHSPPVTGHDTAGAFFPIGFPATASNRPGSF